MTVISQLFWPSPWPLARADFGAVGLSAVTVAGLSAVVINVRHPEGPQANIRPCVTNALYNPRGPDCLSQWV